MREFQTKTIHTGIKAPDGRELERIVLGFELKSLDDEGRGSGFLSVYGNEDSYGDVVESGSFVKTCAERSADNPLPFLWQHDGAEPIGVYTRLDPLHEKGLYAIARNDIPAGLELLGASNAKLAEALGADHPITQMFHMNFAVAMAQAGHESEARAIAEHAEAILSQAMGPDAPNVLRVTAFKASLAAAVRSREAARGRAVSKPSSLDLFS